jgi:hypothetical protein
MTSAKDPDLLKKMTMNIDRVHYDWMQEHLDEAKRLGVIPAGTTMTDIVNQGLKMRIAQLQAEITAAKRPQKK